jgi:hypothetical protein
MLSTRKFEQSFQDAFNKAEVQPSEKVWTNIELDLIKAEGEKMKRRVLFYQLLAAASISFAVLFGGIGLYIINKDEAAHIAQVKPTQSEKSIQETDGDTNAVNRIATQDKSNVNNQDAGTDEVGSQAANAGDPSAEPANKMSPTISHEAPGQRLADGTTASERSAGNVEATVSEKASASTSNLEATNENSVTRYEPHDPSAMPANPQDAASGAKGSDKNGTHLPTLNSEEQPGQIANVQERKSRLPSLYDPKSPELVFKADEMAEPDPVALMFARLNDLEKELAREESTRKQVRSKEKLWTSVGFAAGAFSSIGASNTPPASAAPANMMNYSASNSVVQNQTKASGISYTMGISVGTQVANRWVVQGGFNYLTQMSDYTSTQAIQESGNFKAASVNQLRSDAPMDAPEKFIPTAPYTVNNSNEYISIPLQAGYLVVKRKLVWQLNAGVSTDLFIQNTIDPEGNIDKTTSSPGDASPFRSVNFSGLVGSELSYRFAERYRIGINPGLRYPFSSIYKDNLGLDSTPLTFDVGLRFRYIFR